MGILKPNQGSDIMKQAEDQRIQKKVAEIKSKGEKIAEVVKSEIYSADIEIGDYKTLMEAIQMIITNWFNSEINQKKLKDIATDPSSKK